MKKKKKKKAGNKMRNIVLGMGGFLLLIFGLLVFLKSRELKPCGYIYANGFGLECQCNGELIEKPDEDGDVSEGGAIQYCRGKADKELCFKDFGGGKHHKPYTCSEYKYTVDVLPVSVESNEPLYPDAKFTYRVNMNGKQMMLDTKTEVKCEKVKVMGFFEKINSSYYQGYRIYAEKFECI